MNSYSQRSNLLSIRLASTKLTGAKLTGAKLILITSLCTAGLAGCNNVDNADNNHADNNHDVNEAATLQSLEPHNAPTTVDTTIIEDEETVIIEDTVEPAIFNFNVAQMTSDSIDSVYTILQHSEGISPEQVSCLDARDKTLIFTQAQDFYDKNLTSEELSELNRFYSSPLGQKFIAHSKQQLLTANRILIENPAEYPSSSEMAEINRFLETPLAQKFQHITNSRDENGLDSVIRPIVAADIERCGISDIL